MMSEKAMHIIPKKEGMLVEGLLIANDKIMQQEGLEEPIKQVENVAHLPGIVGYSIAMPDIHWGYGFPIGGVAATDAETGVISPGGVGYDINCGVRVAFAPMMFSELDERAQMSLLQSLFHHIPSGVGRGHSKEFRLSDRDYEAIASLGSAWSVQKGFGFQEDLEATESHGFIPGADIDVVSNVAKERGALQLGSIGSGNHFVEIGEVEEIFEPEIAKAWDIQVGKLYVLIHSGSRGFGHQVCQDTLDLFLAKGYYKGLPDKQLVAAPIQSVDGKNYLAAMACAANYAFNNRQQILHETRQAFSEVLKLPKEKLVQLYDVCHNIAKFETYDGRKLCVHRKGATRAFGPHAAELAARFQETGQPVIVPGDMGRASYIMAGLGNPKVFCSCCHGAGRARSRVQSMKSWKGRDPIHYMKEHGVKVMATSFRTIAEEMPDAYKDVSDVVNSAHEAKLAKKVARLKPKLVIKG